MRGTLDYREGPVPLHRTRQTARRVEAQEVAAHASWLNLIERFFAEITQKRIRRDSFKSVAELEAAIYDYLANHNQNPVAFVWTAKPKVILEKVARARIALEAVNAGTKC